MAVVCGNTKRKTAVVKDMSEFACPEVFHFLIRGAKSAVVEVLLKEEEVIGDDKVKGSFKVRKFIKGLTFCFRTFLQNLILILV